MTLVDAIQLVLELARANIAPENMGVDNERERQIEACNILEDFAVNQLGEE